MVRERLKMIQKGGLLWALLAAILPGLAYAQTVQCPNNVPPDGTGAQGCLSFNKTGCIPPEGTPTGEWACPQFQYQYNVNTYRCDWSAWCLWYKCEYYITTWKVYQDYGCVTSTYYGTWQDANNAAQGSNIGCCS